MKDSILNLVLRRMSEGYEKQAVLYKEMHAVALEQEAVLQREEHNSEIGQLKEEICLALEIDEFAIGKIKERLTGPGVEAFDEVMARLAALLSTIKELDKNNEQTLRKRIKDTKDKLAELQNAKKANKAYQPEKQRPDGVFIDFSK